MISIDEEGFLGRDGGTLRWLRSEWWQWWFVRLSVLRRVLVRQGEKRLCLYEYFSGESE